MALSFSTPKTYGPSSRSQSRDQSGQFSAEADNGALPSGTDFGTMAYATSLNSALVAGDV